MDNPESADTEAMADRERITSDLRRRLPRVKVDVIVLVFLLVTALTLASDGPVFGNVP